MAHSSPILITSDLHFTDRSSDAYRWGVFATLKRLVRRKRVHTVAILGDITDAKDRHSAALVNRIVDELEELAALVKRVVILKGNHDYVDPSTPFFGWLAEKGDGRIEYISDPRVLKLGTKRLLLLPHTDNPKVDWRLLKPTQCVGIFAHMCVIGARAESGAVMQSGITPTQIEQLLPDDVPIISGDIHQPQDLGRVKYVGAPYPVRFGDRYAPRFLLWGDKMVSIKHATIRKMSLQMVLGEAPREDLLRSGDQVKITVDATEGSYSEWQDYTRELDAWCAQYGALLVNIEPVRAAKQAAPTQSAKASSSKRSSTQLLRTFCKRRRITKARTRLGRQLLKDSTDA